MKTFEFKINAGEGNEFTFYFDAQNLHAAEAVAKERTKRGHTFEHVATHPVETLQKLQSENHSEKIPTSKAHTFFFDCTHPKCNHIWTTDSECSHVFQERCESCRVNDRDDSPQTYEHMVDWNEGRPATNLGA